jgi:hypothetical protein
VTQRLLIVEPATGPVDGKAKMRKPVRLRLCDRGSADVGRDTWVLGGVSAADGPLKKTRTISRHFST